MITWGKTVRNWIRFVLKADRGHEKIEKPKNVKAILFELLHKCFIKTPKPNMNIMKYEINAFLK